MDVDGDPPATASTTIDVTIKFRGRSIELSPSADATIADLKSLLQPLTNALPRGQKLIFKGRNLPDSMTLGSADVPNGAKIMLLASHGLHQGSGPITKEALSSPNFREADSGQKMERNVHDFTTEKSRTEFWTATGIITLSGCNLKAIPHEAWRCVSARVLDISDNCVRGIPKQVSSLTSLQKLLMNVNDLSDDSISWEGLSCLKSLSVMALSQNRLTTMPSALGALTSLRQLYVANNLLTLLPSEIGLLTNLEVLKVSNNRLRSIPSTIGDCGMLIEVDFSSNLLEELPHAFCSLKKLKVLHLNNNGLRSLTPALFSNCTQLSTLNLHCTEITMDSLRQCQGWGDFDLRRRSKLQKQLDFRAGSAEFDEGADDKC